MRGGGAKGSHLHQAMADLGTCNILDESIGECILKKMVGGGGKCSEGIFNVHWHIGKKIFRPDAAHAHWYGLFRPSAPEREDIICTIHSE